jgi:hypothetical protein
MELEGLRAYWQRGWPVITPVQDYGPYVPKGAKWDYGHYLTVIGFAGEYVVCQDSSEDNVTRGSGSIVAPGRILISGSDLLSQWHDEDVEGKPYVRFGIAVGSS